MYACRREGEAIKIKPKIEERIIFLKKKKKKVRNTRRKGREGRSRDGKKHGAEQ